MRNRVVDYLTPNYTGPTTMRVFWILFAIALFIRFPFFFRDYIDRDESTFILMGQSWVDGHLPYTQLWDLKPPIVFLFFAAIISIFGKSFIAIRFFGCILIVTSALFSYKLTLGIASKKVAFWVAVGCVLFQSLFGSVQGVMSEHISMAFFMPSLYILVSHQRFLWYFVAGLLMGLAVMTKLNLAYAILLLGLFILYKAYTKGRFLFGLKNAVAYGVGILLVVLATFLPYYFQGIPEVWWRSVIGASLEYAQTTWNSIFEMAPALILLSVFFLWGVSKGYLNLRQEAIQILAIAYLGILFSFVKAGYINGHYLIQLYPILLIFLGIVVLYMPFRFKFEVKPYVLVVLLLLPIEAYKEYYDIIINKQEEGTYFNGEGFEVPEYIAAQRMESKNILFLDFHIAYWVMGVNPPTPSVTHPSNLCRDELFVYYQNPRKTSLEEIQFVLSDLKPQLIVTRKNRLLFKKEYAEENKFMEHYLATEYDTVQIVDNALIYGRLNP